MRLQPADTRSDDGAGWHSRGEEKMRYEWTFCQSQTIEKMLPTETIFFAKNENVETAHGYKEIKR